MNSIINQIQIEIYDINPKFKRQLNESELSDFNDWLKFRLVYKIIEYGYSGSEWYAYSEDYLDDFEVEFKIRYEFT